MKATTPAATTAKFTYRFNPATQKWNVYEDGKFRQPFDTEDAAKTFIKQETDKKGKATRK
ncbi:MAG: hypothetical protein U0X20_17215 [Caldilineaceae bacterium]